MMRLAYWGWVAATLWLAAQAGIGDSLKGALAVIAWLLVTQVVLLNMAWWDMRTDGYVLRKGEDRRWLIGIQRLDGTVTWLDRRQP